MKKVKKTGCILTPTIKLQYTGQLKHPDLESALRRHLMLEGKVSSEKPHRSILSFSMEVPLFDKPFLPSPFRCLETHSSPVALCLVSLLRLNETGNGKQRA